MQIRNKKNNKVMNVYSIEEKDNIVNIRFKEDGKVYTYIKKDIEIFKNDNIIDSLYIYSIYKECYKCHKPTKIYTYIIFDDDTYDNVEYPWDKERLLINQHLLNHMEDSSIEYYGLKVIGGDEILDKMLMEKYPNKIKNNFSFTKGYKCPMNICEHCGASQGEYFIYRSINKKIENMEKINLEDIIKK